MSNQEEERLLNGGDSQINSDLQDNAIKEEDSDSEAVETINYDPTLDSDNDESEEGITTRYSENIISLLKPVSIAMIIVIWAVHTLSPILNSSGVPVSSAVMVYTESESDSGWLKLGGALLNALIVVAMVCVITVILVLLFVYNCYKIIYGWLITSSAVLLFTMGWLWLEFTLRAYSLTIDYFSYFFLLYNFTILGVVSIFWQAPTIFTQAYLIVVSCMTGWWLTRLPEWTTWAILAAVAIYDVIAVLTPKGPLKLLVETAEKRKVPIPGLIYESKKFKLGLGDFVFYSVLVGRASMFDSVTMFACFVCILTGLCLTLFCLGIFKKALPALPISIALGLIFYFVTRFGVTPYITNNSIQQINV
ncbi:presenilin [Acrasis kona]|uniref:Presenilin n=1 Tax=Acrasis kona TaxID=1008807 RepID=A0AAW2YJ87_9EUKA